MHEPIAVRVCVASIPYSTKVYPLNSYFIQFIINF